jgi:hypothetical protein
MIPEPLRGRLAFGLASFDYYLVIAELAHEVQTGSRAEERVVVASGSMILECCR